MEQFATKGKKNIWYLEKLWDLQGNKRDTSIQSTAFVNGILYAFYHDSIIQRYRDGSLLDEFSPSEGILYHANDAEYDGTSFLIVDTGTKETPPMLKKYDQVRNVVSKEWKPSIPGWRMAASSLTENGVCLIVLVEDTDPSIRTKLSICSFDFSSEKVEEIAVLPHWHRYVQGCAVRGPELFITTNDGAHSEKTRFLAYDLQNRMIVHNLVFEGFGESEGMFCTSDGYLLTGRSMGDGKSAVYRLRAKGEAS